jgi:hypothetical protein
LDTSSSRMPRSSQNARQSFPSASGSAKSLNCPYFRGWAVLVATGQRNSASSSYASEYKKYRRIHHELTNDWNLGVFRSNGILGNNSFLHAIFALASCCSTDAHLACS